VRDPKKDSVMWRVCKECGRRWGSAVFRDPAFEAYCKLCGGRLVSLENASERRDNRRAPED
jgi:ribosomal protein S27E